MFKGKQIFILIIQITISIVSSVLLYAIFGGHIIISLIVGNFIAAVCRGIYEDNCIKREYNNGVCKHCNTPYDI
mgnify:CR=1 FL=1